MLYIIKGFDEIRNARINEVVKLFIDLDKYRTRSTFFYIINKLASYNVILG